MESGKISNALCCLSGYSNGCVLSTSDRGILEGKNHNILDDVQEKHPFSYKAGAKYVVNYLKNRLLPFHFVPKLFF